MHAQYCLENRIESDHIAEKDNIQTCCRETVVKT